MTMWITPDGAMVTGDCPFGGRAATAAEIAAWEAERAGSPAPRPISWMEFVGLFTPDEFAAIAVSNDPSVAAFRLLASGLGFELTGAPAYMPNNRLVGLKRLPVRVVLPPL